MKRPEPGKSPKNHSFLFLRKGKIFRRWQTPAGILPRHLALGIPIILFVRGHEPSKDGMFQVFAGGTVINIDGGMAEKYGGKGGALVMGSAGAAWLAYPSMNYTRVPLPESV